MQTLHAENEALKARLAGLEWGALRSKIAAEFGLPDGAASRLAGDTEDELRADAESLRALIAPTPATPPVKRPVNTTPVPSGKAQGETEEQRRARLHGRTGSIFEKRG